MELIISKKGFETILVTTKRYSFPGMMLIVHEDADGNKTYEKIFTLEHILEMQRKEAELNNRKLVTQ